MQEKRYSVNIDKETRDALEYLARATKLTKKQILSDIIGEMAGIAYNLHPCNGCNRITYAIDAKLTSNTVEIFFVGASKIINGAFLVPNDVSDEEVDRMVSEKITDAIESEKKRSES